MPNMDKPNIIFFFVDNLGFGELGCYGGGILRGADTARIDRFAYEGTRLTNFAPEAQCTPSRSALMTGRYAARSGTQSVPIPGLGDGGLVAWERTIAEILSDPGYATLILGKWHLGHSQGRWPTDHGFDAWYGIPRSYDECLWSEDPWYDPQRDPVSYVMEGRKGEPAREVEQLTVDVRRDIDVEYERRARDFIKRNADAGRPFFLYYCHSLLHLPTIPRAEFKGATGHGDFADCLLELDHDFGRLLDHLDQLGIVENTIVVFFGDNGPEESQPWRGTSGFFEGSYFTGMEGSLRTPCIIRWPGRVPAGRSSDEIVHITDLFTTMVRWGGGEVPPYHGGEQVGEGGAAVKSPPTASSTALTRGSSSWASRKTPTARVSPSGTVSSSTVLSGATGRPSRSARNICGIRRRPSPCLISSTSSRTPRSGRTWPSTIPGCFTTWAGSSWIT